MKNNTFSNELLLLLFNNTAIASISDAGGLTGSGSAGNFWISLHTANPGGSGTQSTSECNYTGYARVSIARTSGQWSVSAGNVLNVNPINFATCTGGTNTATYFGIGIASSGSTTLLYSGALTTPLAISNGITPSFAASELNVTES